MTTSTERHRHALPLGQQVRHYTIEDQLGHGSFGITYLAQDTSLHRPVAIKELLPTMIASRYDTVMVGANSLEDQPSWAWARQRFLEEARALARCVHPNVLHVYETFEENGTAYMVTRYEEGCNFHQWLEQLGRPMTQGELELMLRALLSALKCVHGHGFYHRDIKPENIYITRNGKNPILIDFGSAREEVTSRSVPVTAIVTEGYAPFEQYSVQSPQGPWIDLYALGAVMYTAITREMPPFAPLRTVPGADPYQPLAPRYAHAYDSRFLELIDVALRMDIRGRPQSAAEWESFLDSRGPLPAPPAPVPVTVASVPAAEPVNWIKWVLAAAMVLLGTLIAVLVLVWTGWRDYQRDWRDNQRAAEERMADLQKRLDEATKEKDQAIAFAEEVRRAKPDVAEAQQALSRAKTEVQQARREAEEARQALARARSEIQLINARAGTGTALVREPLVEVSGHYKGSLRDSQRNTVELSIVLDPGGRTGEATYRNKLGETVVSFDAIKEESRLRVTTGKVVRKSRRVSWTREIFLLRFSDDGSMADYECESPRSTMAGRLTKQ